MVRGGTDATAVRNHYNKARRRLLTEEYLASLAENIETKPSKEDIS